MAGHRCHESRTSKKNAREQTWANDVTKTVKALSLQQQGEDMPKIKLKAGSIRQRPNGLFEVRFIHEGQRISVYEREEIACIKKANKKIKELKTMPLIAKTVYFDSWLQTWLETYKKPNVSEGQFKALEVCIRLHLMPNIQHKDISKVTELECQNILNKINGVRAKKDAFSILKNAFDKAVAMNYVAKSPIQFLEKPKYKKQKGTPLSKQEQAQFLIDVQHVTEKQAFLFLLYSGLRRGELLSLKWSDVKENTLHVPGTKTATSNRIIPLFDKLKAILNEMPKKTEFIFDHVKDTLTKKFKKLCPEHKLHDLRHTFATNCLEIGIPMKVVQQWLGHADFGTTANIYSTVLEKFNKEQAEVYNKKMQEHTPICTPIQKK